jgi:protein-tyrosine phosphatase
VSSPFRRIGGSRWVRRLTRRRHVQPLTVRQVAFTGMVNFRDLGGLSASGGTVRPGLLYRSDSLAYASERDARRLIRDLGVVTVVDLRGQFEVDRLGRGPLADAPVAYLPAPIVDVSWADDLSQHYLSMLAERGTLLASVIRRLAQPGALPAVFHCEAGCDRTGVLAAAVLSLLGVPDEEIAEDYALTAPAMPAIHARVREVAIRLGLPPRPPAAVEWAPEAEMMAGTLKLARERWGGMREWAVGHGLTEPELTALHTVLVDPRPAGAPGGAARSDTDRTDPTSGCG